MHRRLRDSWFHLLCYGLLLIPGLELSIEGAISMT